MADKFAPGSDGRRTAGGADRATRDQSRRRRRRRRHRSGHRAGGGRGAVGWRQLVAGRRSRSAGQALAGVVDRPARPGLRARADRRHGGLGEEPGRRPAGLPGGGRSADHRSGDRQRRRSPDWSPGSTTRSPTCNIADKIGDELQSLGLPPKLATLATAYLATFRTDITNAITKMVDELVQSPKLATIWDNRERHAAHQVRPDHAGRESRQAAHPQRRSQRGGDPGQAEAGVLRASAGRPRFPTSRW